MGSTSPGMCLFFSTLIFLGSNLASSSNEFDNSPSCNAMVCQCTEPDLSADCSSRGFLTLPSGLPSSIQAVIASGNKIGAFNSSELIQLEHLKSLDLSNNELTDFNMMSIHYNLESLDLSGNNISSVRALQLSGLIKLSRLNLAHNKIMSIPSNVFVGSNLLKYLNLRANRIVSLEAGSLDNLTSLQELILTKNRLSSFPKGVFNKLQNLQTLELNKNKFVEIQGLSFHGLDNLRVLKLKRNNIEFLMDGAFYGLHKIEELHLDRNKVKGVEKDWLYGLSTLKYISLAHNKVEYISDDTWEFCEVLDTVDLSSNALQLLDRDSLRMLPRLKNLYLQDNIISHIQDDDTFAEVPMLETLALDDNELSHTIEDMLAPFKGLKNLKRLSLSKNHIKSIGNKAFVGLEKLEVLNVEDNVISTVQENPFNHLNQLKSIKINSKSMLCDCYLKWFPLWLNQTDINGCSASCAHPENLKNHLISSIAYESYTCDDFPKPYILQQPETQITLKGNNLTLICQAASTSSDDMIFEWKIDSDVLEYPEDPNCGSPEFHFDRCIKNVDHSFDGKGRDVTSQLHLSNLTYDDAGKYQCVVSNSYGATYSDKANITVYVYPQFLITPEDITVEGGATAALKCAAKGVPAPKVSWSKDSGSNFPAATERRIAVSSFVDNEDKKTNINSFLIYGVKAKDMGTYQCTASNPAGSISWNISLSVLEVPRFVKPMESKEVEEGETAVIECLASGSPKPRLTWTKDDQALDGTKERHFFTADNQLLIIVKFTKKDAGRYECTMHNQLGTESQSSILKIKPVTSGPNSSPIASTVGIVTIAVICCILGVLMVWLCNMYMAKRRRQRSLPETINVVPGRSTVVGNKYKGWPGSNNFGKKFHSREAESIEGFAEEFDIHAHVMKGLMPESSSPLGQTQLDHSTGVLTTDLSKESESNDLIERDSGTGDSKKSNQDEEEEEEMNIGISHPRESDSLIPMTPPPRTITKESQRDDGDYKMLGAGESTISLSELRVNGGDLMLRFADDETESSNESVSDDLVAGAGEDQCDLSSSLASLAHSSSENNKSSGSDKSNVDTSVQFRTFYPNGRIKSPLVLGSSTMLDLNYQEQLKNNPRNCKKRASAVELNNGHCYVAIEPEDNPHRRSVVNLVEPSVYRGGVGSLPRHGLEFQQEILEASLNRSREEHSNLRTSHDLPSNPARLSRFGSKRKRSLSRGRLKQQQNSKENPSNREHSNVVLKSKDLF